MHLINCYSKFISSKANKTTNVIDKFLKIKSIMSQDSPFIEETCVSASDYFSKKNHIDLKNHLIDLGFRKKISEYHLIILNDQDDIRTTYIQKGYFQPLSHKFSQKSI